MSDGINRAEGKLPLCICFMMLVLLDGKVLLTLLAIDQSADLDKSNAIGPTHTKPFKMVFFKTHDQLQTCNSILFTSTRI